MCYLCVSHVSVMLTFPPQAPHSSSWAHQLEFGVALIPGASTVICGQGQSVNDGYVPVHVYQHESLLLARCGPLFSHTCGHPLEQRWRLCSAQALCRRADPALLPLANPSHPVVGKILIEVDVAAASAHRRSVARVRARLDGCADDRCCTTTSVLVPAGPRRQAAPFWCVDDQM